MQNHKLNEKDHIIMNNHFDGLGAAFYPEQQPRHTWEPYVEKLAEAGLSFVRIAEFAWDKLEPEDGKYDFAWLDEVLAMLAEKNIRAIMCTPGATPPVWICEKYDFYPRLDKGSDFRFGIRRYVCPNSPDFLKKSWDITAKMGEHYANDPRIMAWQIDNEIGHPFCFCDRCKALFQQYMKDKFGTVENMNNTLDFHFWGQTVQRFDQLPMPTEFTHSSLWTYYHRFYSDSVIKCFGTQADILRKKGVTAPITTNSMTTWHGYEQDKFAKYLDYSTGDYYFGGNMFGGDIFGLAFANAYLRGFKQTVNPRYNEFRGGKVCDLTAPGEIRYHTMAAIAMGADHVDYFRWDTCPSGQERNQYGIIRTLEYPGRYFYEVKEIAAELAALHDRLDGSAPAPAQTAILYSYDTHCDTAEYHQDFPEYAQAALCGNQYPVFLSKHFKSLMKLGENPDILFPTGDFSRYKVIICPGLQIMTNLVADKLREFVKNGGTLLMLTNCGTFDEHGQTSVKGIPGQLADVMGIHCVDYGRFPKYTELTFASEKYPDCKVTNWMEELIPDPDTEILGKYKGTPGFDGVPAFTLHQYGTGKAYYLGICPEPEKELQDFYRTFYKENGIEFNGWTDGTSFRFKRFKPDGSYLEFQITPSERKLEIIP